MRMVSYLTPGYPAELFEEIARHLGADLSFDSTRSGPAPDADPFASGRADIGWICSTSFVELTSGPRPSVREVGIAWVPDDADAQDRPVYFSDLVVRGDSAVAALDDLEGQRIGCNDPASLSGFHALRFELDRRGRAADSFASMIFTGGHQTSMDRLIAGELDAAVVDSIVRTGRAHRSREVAGLRVIQRLGPWPTQPVVMRADARPDDVAAVRDALLRANDKPEIAALLTSASLTRLAPTGPEHCTAVRTAMARLAPT